MYDWANSAFVTTVIAAVFPAFYASVAAAGLPEGAGEARYSAATVLAVVVAALISPVLGAYADDRPTKKRFLAYFLALGVASTAGMFFIGSGDWLLACTLFALGNVGAMGSFVFYDALLPHIAREEEVDRVSTVGYALGYMGGGVLLAFNLAWIMKPELFGLPSGPNLTSKEATLPARLAFLSVAVWWLVFAIPLFRKVPEPPVRPLVPGPGRNAILTAFERLRSTFRELKTFRHAFLMLLAYLVYADGIGTIIRMAVIYGTVIGIDQSWMILAILLTQFVGVPFALLFGVMAGKVGGRRAIMGGLVVYMGIAVLAYFMTTHWHFLMLAVLVGMVQGGTQALSRSLFASMIPVHKSGEFFGLYGVMDRFSGSMGTALLGIVVAVGLPMRVGILSIIIFFIGGAILLMKVNVKEGISAARAAEVRAGAFRT